MTSNIGKTIRILRSAKGKSLSELAADAKLSVPFLSLVESGKRQPSLAVLKTIGDALGVSSDVMLLLEMGPSRTLRTNDRKTIDITRSIEKLMKIEGKLKEILGSTSPAHESV
jgi:transcriptional regulator with XRE-family HTH domain